uniref:cytochrome b5-like n=1 Tax=Erigeron canadensis TaxID=72917 RepID=UPI001CB94324|nr:cytochrome b5-like [Erigeron canadensis]
MGSEETKIISLEEASKHATKDDCWLIISGKVYDITPFLDDHPGGDEVLVLATKKDATEDFEDVGHSQNARDMLKDYYVGDIDVNTLPKKGQYKPPSSSGSGSEKASGSSSNNSVMLFLPILILVLAYAYYYFSKTDKVGSHA